MKILAIETSTTTGSIALLEGAVAVGGQRLPEQPRPTQTLLSAISAELTKRGWSTSDVELVAVTIGPGSFTGLRIGVTTAKTLAYAVNLPIVGVDALEVSAWQVVSDEQQGDTPQPGCVLESVADAQRKELFHARFEVTESDDKLSVRRLCPTAILTRDAWLNQLEENSCVTGPGLKPLVDRLPDHVQVAPQRLWVPRAIAVGQLAWRDYRAGRRDDLWKLAPDYQRKSAAEEKAERVTATIADDARRPEATP